MLHLSFRLSVSERSGRVFFLLGIPSLALSVLFFRDGLGNDPCVFRPAWAGLGNRATHMWHRTVAQDTLSEGFRPGVGGVFHVLPLFVLLIPPRSGSRGRSTAVVCKINYVSTRHTVAQETRALINIADAGYMTNSSRGGAATGNQC